MQKGFFKSLFDFSFTSFVTGKVIKFLYILLLVLLAITYVGVAIALFVSGGSEFEYNSFDQTYSTSSGGNVAAGLIWLFVAGPILLFLYTLLYRVFLEFIIVVFRIYENSRSAVALMRAQWPEAAAAVDAAGPGHGAYGGTLGGDFQQTTQMATPVVPPTVAAPPPATTPQPPAPQPPAQQPPAPPQPPATPPPSDPGTPPPGTPPMPQ